jgi:hypothetical protein
MQTHIEAPGSFALEVKLQLVVTHQVDPPATRVLALLFAFPLVTDPAA